MKREVERVLPQDSVQTAARRMRVGKVGFLPVCNESGKVLGAITDRDLTVRVLADGRAPTTPVREVLTHEVIACRPEDDLRKAEELMARHHKSRIMCIDESGRLQGVLSLSDIAQHELPARASRTLRDVSEREAHH